MSRDASRHPGASPSPDASAAARSAPLGSTPGPVRAPALAPPLMAFLAALSARDGVWLVGGWVRDTLAGRLAHDVDVATSAPLERLEAAAQSARLRLVPGGAGAAHGAYRVGVPGTHELLDVAMLRRDVARVGTRHAQTARTDDIEEDLARRDLTINSMALPYPLASPPEVIDPFGGRADLAAGRLCLVGAPQRRLEEDPLRLVRVARFACLGERWHIEPATRAALAACAPLLAGISAERLHQELMRAMAMPAPWRFWAVLQDAGATAHLLPSPPSATAVRLDLNAGGRWLRAAARRAPQGHARLTAFVLGATMPAGAAGPSTGARQQFLAALARQLRLSRAEATALAEPIVAFPAGAEAAAALEGDALAAWLVGLGARAWRALQLPLALAEETGAWPAGVAPALVRRAQAMLQGAEVPGLGELALDGQAVRQRLGGVSGPALGAALRGLLVWGLAHGAWRDAQALGRRLDALVRDGQAGPTA